MSRIHSYLFFLLLVVPAYPAEMTLNDAESFHSKMLNLAKIHHFSFEYTGILSRKASNAGLIRENRGEWLIHRKSKYDFPILMRSSEASKYVIRIKEVDYYFNFFDVFGGRIVDDDLISGYLGFKVGELIKLINETEEIHHKNPDK